MVARTKQQMTKTRSTLEQRRSQLYAAALFDFPVDYVLSSPVGVRLECCIPTVGRQKQTGECNSLNPGRAQFTNEKKICANVSSNKREVEFPRITSGMKVQYILIFLDFLWFSLDRMIWKMSFHVQFPRVCPAHLAHPEYTPWRARYPNLSSVYIKHH